MLDVFIVFFLYGIMYPTVKVTYLIYEQIKNTPPANLSFSRLCSIWYTAGIGAFIIYSMGVEYFLPLMLGYVLGLAVGYRFMNFRYYKIAMYSFIPYILLSIWLIDFWNF